ncbi:MAG: cobalamin-binding protein [Wenzhouxiangellaceae bacterium]
MPADDTAVRVVSLAPHLTELAFEAGVGDRLVGVVAYSDTPPAATTLPQIGDAFRFDLERIVRLGATHALAWQGGTPAVAIRSLRELGLTVLEIGIERIDQIPGALRRIGALGGNPAIAEARATAFESALAEMLEQRPDGPAIPVFYQVSERPMFTLGRRHVINDVFRLCGASNVFADLDTEAAAVGLESVLERKPLVLILSEPGMEGFWTPQTTLRAVRCGHLMQVDPAVLVRPTPRLLEGARALCTWLDHHVRQAEDPACRSGGD